MARVEVNNFLPVAKNNSRFAHSARFRAKKKTAGFRRP
jgi:hypothetical protein